MKTEDIKQKLATLIHQGQIPRIGTTPERPDLFFVGGETFEDPILALLGLLLMLDLERERNGTRSEKTSQNGSECEFVMVQRSVTKLVELQQASKSGLAYMLEQAERIEENLKATVKNNTELSVLKNIQVGIAAFKEGKELTNKKKRKK
ncbi:MAG: hypothetical protein ACRCXN_12960 [Bacteroidales bacterium]